MMGPLCEASEKLHANKYRGRGESFKEMCNRVGAVLAPGDEFKPFRDIMLGMRFMPAGRVQGAIGSTKNITPYNCYVSGTIEDSFIDGHGSIMGRAHQAAATMRMGGGIGYDFSTLRPRGAEIKKLGSQSSGPISFMRIFDAVCLCTASSGHRRGAQMGILRIDHPDIEEFVRSKRNDNALTGFNISVAVTDEFMVCLEEDKPFDLRFEGKVYETVDPKVLWELIMRSTWDWAEPGVIFIDHVNGMNNLAYCETIAATNPCGEQPLPPYGACLLGSFNLTKYLCQDAGSLSGSGYAFDWKQFRADIPLVVRAMDRVVDVATYPLFEQEKEAKRKRRMGLGVTGVANALEVVYGPYGSGDFLAGLREVLRTLRDEAYRASIQLAEERGAFPALKRDAYLGSGFAQTLPDDIRLGIAEKGIRNSHLLSVAPTGTISLCADNVSSGIEPVFDYVVDRRIETFDGPVDVQFEDYGSRHLGHKGRRAEEVSPNEHLAVLATAYEYVDSAVSKTCNVPGSTEWEDFKDLYMNAWRAGCKGITTYTVGGQREAVMRSAEPTAGATCERDPVTGRTSCD